MSDNSLFYSSASSEHARTVYEDIDIPKHDAPFTLGPYNTHHLLADPKRIGFMFARYKFVAKMLAGQQRVLEVGCQEGLGALIVASEVGSLTAVDFFRPHIESCRERMSGAAPHIEFMGHDIISGPVGRSFTAAYSLDVFEHIDPAQEDRFMSSICSDLTPHGILIIGMPSLESQCHASPESKAGHINCKSGEALRSFCDGYFHNVFMFGMNDEVVHTGFLPMAHYLFAVCVAPRQDVSQ